MKSCSSTKKNKEKDEDSAEEKKEIAIQLTIQQKKSFYFKANLFESVSLTQHKNYECFNAPVFSQIRFSCFIK